MCMDGYDILGRFRAFWALEFLRSKGVKAMIPMSLSALLVVFFFFKVCCDG